MRAHSLVLALLVGVLISGESPAREASGTTVGVNPDAKAAGTGGTRVIRIEGPIYMGDVITTNQKGQVEIIFLDDTKFVVGANSKVTIDAFVFNANRTAQNVSLSAVRGAFRFITGRSPKDNYSIRTPTMTIGVRGTAFDLAVRPGSGESMVVVHEGETNLCDASRRCSEGRSGSMTVASGEGLRSIPPGRELSQRLNAYFPLILNQSRLKSAFIVRVSPILRSADNEPRHDGTGDNERSDDRPARAEQPGRDPDGRPP